jgi:YihY family inner membrane protein
MNVLERTLRVVDRAQRRRRPLAFTFGVVKKFGDDRGGLLCAMLAFYGFLSIFPLLLLLVTVLGFAGGGTHSLAHRIESSAFSYFPVVGSNLSSNIHALHERSVVALVVGLLFVLWGSQGALQTAQHVQAEVWNVPGAIRPNFWARLGRTACMIVVLFVFLVATTLLAGLATIGHHGAWAAIGAAILSLFLNIGVSGVGFRLLTPRQIAWRNLWPGALVGGVGWTVLQYAGGLLVAHSLQHASRLYGNFAVVLGLLAFLYLSAEVTVYAAEINVVKARHLWPRSIVQPPLTAADREVLSALALENKRRPEQYVAVGFTDDDSKSGDDNDNNYDEVDHDDENEAVAVPDDPSLVGEPPRLDASGIPRTA